MQACTSVKETFDCMGVEVGMVNGLGKRCREDIGTMGERGERDEGRRHSIAYLSNRVV